MAYFDTKSGSLEEAIRQAVGGQINEKVTEYIELEFKDKQAAINAYKTINNKVYPGGMQPFSDINQEGNTIQLDKVDNSKKVLGDFKKVGKLKFKVAVEEKLDPVNKKALKKDFDDRKDKDIDNDGDVDSSDKYLAKRRKAVSKAMKGEEVKYPHKMYDPKTGKEVTAKTPEDHEKYAKMGYTHDKPKMEGLEDSPNPANSQHLCAKNVVHEEWGEGNPVHGQHADPDENGDIAWYDVIFEHGVEKGVSINELKVTKAESHHDHKKKKVKENYDVGTPENTKAKLDATPGQSSDDWNQQVEMMQGKNNSMREALAKMWGVDEGHNPFEKKEGKQSNPDNFEPFKKKSKKEDKTMTGKPMTKVEVDPDMKEVKIGKKTVR